MAPHLHTAALMFAAAALFAGPAAAQDGDGMEGRTYALTHCTECHNVGAGHQRAVRPSGAPDFTAIANAPTTTLLGLEVFLTTPHAKMPNFVIAESDRRDVIAYISSLKKKTKGR